MNMAQNVMQQPGFAEMLNNPAMMNMYVAPHQGMFRDMLMFMECAVWVVLHCLYCGCVIQGSKFYAKSRSIGKYFTRSFWKKVKFPLILVLFCVIPP